MANGQDAQGRQGHVAEANMTARMAAETAERARMRREAAETRSASLAKVQGRFAGVGGKVAVAAALVCGGAVLATSGLAACLLGVAASVVLPGFAVASSIAPGLIAVAGVVLVCVGCNKGAYALRFRKYQKAIGSRESIDVSELSRAVARPAPKVVQDLHKMLKQGLFLQGHLDANDTTLMLTDNSYDKYLETVRSERALELETAMADSVTPKSEPKPLSEQASETLRQGQAYLAKIRTCKTSINNAEIGYKIDKIELVLGNIFKRVEEKAEHAGDLTRLMSYYLPQTVKLLDSYIELQEQPVQGENIVSSKAEISKALDTLASAYEKLLDSTFRDTAWDVSTDISVLNTVLAQEGLTDAPFKKQ